MDPAVAAALDGLPFAGGHQQAIPVQLHPLATNMFQMPMPHQVPHPQVEDDDKILADIAAEGRERFQNTLVGRLAEYMRDVGEPVSIVQCIEALRDVFPELKKPDGSTYKGSLERAIHGALWSTGVFRKSAGDFWSLREEDAAEYERRLTGRFQERNKKRKTLSVAAQHLIPVEKRSRKKYSRKPGKRADVVRLLAQFSASHKETEERAALANGGVVSAELEALFKNPFKGWTVHDSELKVRRRLGDDKYRFLMQVFHYFEDLLMNLVDVEDGYQTQHAQAAKAARMPSMGKIEKQLATVLERLTQVEGALTQPPAAAPPANADV